MNSTNEFEMTDADVMAGTPCPTCGAQRGEACTRPNGRPYHRLHADRGWLAQITANWVVLRVGGVGQRPYRYFGGWQEGTTRPRLVDDLAQAEVMTGGLAADTLCGELALAFGCAAVVPVAQVAA